MVFRKKVTLTKTLEGGHISRGSLTQAPLPTVSPRNTAFLMTLVAMPRLIKLNRFKSEFRSGEILINDQMLLPPFSRLDGFFHSHLDQDPLLCRCPKLVRVNLVR